MQKTHQYAKTVPSILAEMGQDRQGDNIQHKTDEQGTLHVYPLEGGGFVLTTTPIGEEPEPTIIDAQRDDPDTRPTARHSSPYIHLLRLLLLFCIFTALDNVDTVLAQLAPVVTITITPVVKTISTTVAITVGGSGAEVRGRVLAPLTLSQEQTVSATGKGHQDVTRAAGSITFFNGSFSTKTIDAGTVFTGSSGIQVVTDQTVLIPAGNPPTYGEATVSALAVHAGAQGNIGAGDINTSVSSDILAKNNAFSGGRDARDFTKVSKSDIQSVVAQLTPQLIQSEQAAMTARLVQGETLVTPSCTPAIKTSHAPGDEALTVSVTVSEICASVAYDQQQLQRAGTRIQATRAASLPHYSQVGEIKISILSQMVNGQRASLRVQLVSAWVYSLNERELTQRIIGKPRLDAIHLLEETPGVKSVTIAGVSDNQQLPTDPAHVHLSLFALLP